MAEHRSMEHGGFRDNKYNNNLCVLIILKKLPKSPKMNNLVFHFQALGNKI